MSLHDWLASGWLTPHEPSREEIKNLLALADRDLHDCLTPDLSTDWRFQIAYNAALQVATAALAAAGYRASREAHHYRVLQSLAHTVGLKPASLRQFDVFRKKRNVGGYQQAGCISDQEAREMAEAAAGLRGQVEKWLRRNHPELL